MTFAGVLTMKLEWMGRNRELIRMLYKYINLSSKPDKPIPDKSGISINAQQWQTLECIIEYEDENKNMAFMAKQMGIPKSSFTKNIKLLVDYGLIDRYQQAGNRKDIILKPSNKGRAFYQKRSKVIFEYGWKEPFAALDKLTDENLAIFVEFLLKMAAEKEPENNKARELFKLQ